MRLLQNEMVKLFKTKKLYIFFGIFMAMRIAAAYFYNSGSTIQTVIETANAQSFPIAMKYDAMQFLCIFMAIYIADILTDEYTTGTIKLSLLRPISRARFINSKIAAMVLFTVILTAFSVLSTYAIGLAFFGWGDSTIYHGITYTTIEGLLLTAKVYASSVLPLVAFGTVCAFVAVMVKNMSVVVAVSLMLFMGGQLLSAIPSVKMYSVVNHMFFLSDYFVKGSDTTGLLMNVVVNLAYIAVFYTLTLVAFKKKDILC